MDIKRLSSLDSLRGIAAIGVAFFWHYQHFNPQNGFPFSQKGYWFYHFGWNLVDLFFVLSGFIFSYVYKNRIIDNTISLKQYSVLRFSRLYPLHLLTLLFVSIIQFIRFLLDKGYFVYQVNDVYHFILNVFFIQSGGFDNGWSFNAPTWSVSGEILVYLLFFIIINKFAFNNKNILYYIGLLFIGLAIYQTNLNLPLFNEKIARVLIGFFVGCLTYEIYKFLLNKRFKALVTTSFAVILIITSLGSVIFGYEQFFGEWPLVNTLLIYPLVILITLNVKIINNVLSIKPLTYLGDISYSLYLCHFPVQLLIKTVDDIFMLNLDYSSKIVFLGVVIVTILVSIASFEFFEKPCQKFIRNKLLNTDNYKLNKTQNELEIAN